MTTIASLIVNLGMQTSKFDSGARKARGSLRSFAEGAVAVNAAMGVAGMALATAKRGLDEFAQSSESIDNLGKLSDRLGISTENLGALQHAASLAGVESTALSNGLQKMSVNLAKAMQGGESAKVFERLGLDAQQLISLNPWDALGKIADEINRLPTPAEKSAAAIELFGKNGGPLLTMLAGGSKGLAEMRCEADRLGLTFDRLSAQQVEAANDAMTRATAVWTGFKQKAVIGLAPFLEAGAKTMERFTEELSQGNLFGSFYAVSQAAEYFDNLDVGISAAAVSQERMAKATDKAAAAMDRQKQQVSSLHKFYDALYQRESARFDLIEAGLTPLEQYEEKQASIAQMLRELEKDRFGYTTPLIDDESYQYQKAGLERQLENNAADEAKRVKEERDGTFGSQIAAAMKSPLAKYLEAVKDIDSKTDEIFGGEGSNFLNAEQSRFAKLQAKQSYLQELGTDDADRGALRPGAIERGTSAAYSASFGQRSIEKQQAEMLRVEREMRDLLRSIDRKAPQPFAPSA